MSEFNQQNQRVNNQFNAENINFHGRQESWEYLYTFTKHNDKIRKVIFSPDGLYVASAGLDDSYIYIWDIKEGKVKTTIFDSHDWTNDLSFSPDGEKLAVACEDHFVRIFHVHSGRLLETLGGHTDGVWRVAFSKDGLRIASGGQDKTIRLYGTYRSDLKNVMEVRNRIQGLEFYPNNYNGNYLLISADTQEIYLWDTQTGEARGVLEDTPLGQIFQITLSSDNLLLACSSYNDIHLWHIPEKKHLGKVTERFEFIWTVRFDPTAHILAFGNENGTVEIWDIMKGKNIHTLRGHTKRVCALTYSNDGQFLVSGSDDHTIRVWRRRD